MVDKVKTLEDLKKLREEALEKRRVKSAAGHSRLSSGWALSGSLPARAKPSKPFWIHRKRKPERNHRSRKQATLALF